MTKELQEADRIIESVKNLKQEMFERGAVNVDARAVFFKLNSCLFSKYPHHEKDPK